MEPITDALRNELAPLLARKRELESTHVTIADAHRINNIRYELDLLKTQIVKVRTKHGDYIAFNAINSDRDNSPSERCGTFSPSVTYTVCSAGLVWQVAPKSVESCYDMHEWLLKIKAIRPTVKSDHEYSGLFWYFSSEKAAQNFITRINKVVHQYAIKNGLI